MSQTLSMRRVFVVLGVAFLFALVLMLALRGALVLGGLLGIAGLIVLWLFSIVHARDSRRKRTSTAGSSDDETGVAVKTDFLDVRVDSDTNLIRGRVVKGLFSGARIGDLKPVELALLWQDCRADDPASANLIEGHLDKVAPNWRDEVRRGEANMASGPDGRMSVPEALKILGLSSGATRDQVRHAHRDLMLKLHPDRGGSTYLASKVNEAKEVLLSRKDT